MADFEAALGFAPPLPLPDRPVFVASFKDFDRWSHEGVLRRIVEGDCGIRLADGSASLKSLPILKMVGARNA